MDHRAVGDGDAGADHHERLDRDVAAELGVGGKINGFRRDQRHAGVERRLAQPRLHHRFRFRKLRLGVDAAHFVFAGLDHDGLQSFISRTMVTASTQIILALAVGIADLVEDRQRLAPVERHHAGIAQRDLRAALALASACSRIASQVVAFRPAAGRSRSDRRRESRAPRAQRRLSSGARRRAKVSAEISGVSPNAISRSSAPRAIASRAASTACAVPSRSRWTKVAASGRTRFDLVRDRLVVRPDHHRERGAVRRAGRHPAHAPAATGRRPDAGLLAATNASACPRRPQAPPSGWIEQSSALLDKSLAAERAGPSLIVFPRR